ncbi:Hsp20 family protein [Modestobacter sp. I12A-02628]|uniref:Hsp20/alpha crystallin family protein n=1 Tax=Goekera deserti TaxID=2497753 RepID=A0A7K3WIM5_9ACTN|nr:Hsp20/alpha crystallin family protein [Goekera deserti]MPQ96707.1 Hsp20 family protein [Goekera deserti]NDI46979.1 Hsp20 family protein [Goekera deserti]NEL56216.1 Hsp20/alpha crystallin family protein [Goekera deserti]
MLTAYDPFSATSAAFRALDQLAGRAGTTTARPLAGMPMDAYRVGDHFVAHFDLPGVDPGSIDLTVEGTTLTISAERSVPRIEGAEWSVAERPFGSYTRQLVLGRSLDTDRLEASYHDGVLTVSIPVTEKARARKIEVTRADSPVDVAPHSIEGSVREDAAAQG